MPRIIFTITQCNSSGAGRQVFVRLCLYVCMDLFTPGKCSLLVVDFGNLLFFLQSGSFILLQHGLLLFSGGFVVWGFFLIEIKQSPLSCQMCVEQLRLSLCACV